MPSDRLPWQPGPADKAVWAHELRDGTIVQNRRGAPIIRVLSASYGDPEEVLQMVEDGDGDPEAVLLRLEEEREAFDTSAAMEEIRACLKLVRAADREILYLWDVEGVTQTKIAVRVGVSQPSVSSRISVLRSWLRYVIPIRLELRRLLAERAYPTEMDSYAYRGCLRIDAESLFRGLIWEHRNQSEVARVLGISQGAVRCRWGALARIVSGELGEILRGLVHWYRWVRPNVRNDTPLYRPAEEVPRPRAVLKLVPQVVEPAHEVVQREPEVVDPVVGRMIAELDLAIACYQYERRFAAAIAAL